MQTLFEMLIFFVLVAICTAVCTSIFLWQARRELRAGRIPEAEYVYWKGSAWQMFFVLSMVFGFIPLSIWIQSWFK